MHPVPLLNMSLSAYSKNNNNKKKRTADKTGDESKPMGVGIYHKSPSVKCVDKCSKT